MEFDLHKIIKSLNLKGDWTGLREVREKTTMRSARDGKPELNESDISHGVMIEVLHKGQIAYAATNDLSLAALQSAADRAYAQAEMMSRFPVFIFDESVRPKAQGNFSSPFQKDMNLMSAGDINHFLVDICNTLKVSDKIINTTATARIIDSWTRFVSTNGSDVFQEYNIIATDYAATAKDGNEVQKRSDNGSFARSHQAGAEVFDIESVKKRAHVVGEQAIDLLSAINCPTETTNMVLAPDQMLLQIHESIGHPLEVDRILGDERNYAGSSFVKLSDIGTLQYGSKLLNITFDPTRKGQMADYRFDDAGLEAKKEYIIKEGLLVRAEGSTESQQRSGVPGVANFRAASWNRQAIDRMANLNLEPGDSSFDDIISSIDRGIYMESNRSWSIDDYRRKFQFGCEYGKLIENGKLTKTVKNPNYKAITTQFWNSLKAVGDASTFQMYGTPFCGKGEPNQIMRVGHASPVAYSRDIDVFGGEE
ncbi:MAG: TldD/PmbA family protein [Candidatus Marinimicrobia bacterium]|nr:TldD/PmbA family protein [Candidatus Neomarinimicrobiota bacterium]